MLKIKRNALLSALQGAKETHPNEFICLIRGDKDGEDWLLTDVIIAPFSNYDKNSSSYSMWYVPANTGELASFHSHPSPNAAFPSAQDLRYFSRSSPFHFIACFPYRIEDTKAFDSKGKEIEWKAV